MAELKFNIGQGGLGRPLNGKDYYSAFLFDSNVYPSGMSALAPIALFGSLQDAEDLGILDDGTGETVATGGEIDITAVGAAGDTWTVSIKSTNQTAILLATVIEGSAETLTTVATRIAAEINETKNKHGFSATSAIGTVSLVMAANWGEAFNTAGLTAVSSGAGTSTVTQFDSGVGSDFSIMHYHISEFFRIQPKGLLWFGIYDETAGLDVQDIYDIVNFADGEVRQMAFFLKTAFATSDLTIIQSAITVLQPEYKYLNAIYAADQLGDTITAVSDLRALTNDRVSVCMAQDGGGEGWRLMDVEGISISALGAALGTIALSNVSENIGWVAKFNLLGVELDALSFTTGDLYKAISTNTLSLLSNRGYIFARKYIGKSGSYFNDSATAVSETSDYAFIENGRTIDKAMRGINIALTDYLNSPLIVDPDTGFLFGITTANIRNSASNPLQQIVIDGDLSGFEVIIDPDQDVLTTSSIELTVKLVPIGTAREIIVNIGYTLKLQT